MITMTKKKNKELEEAVQVEETNRGEDEGTAGTNLLTQEEFKKIASIVSPEPEVKEDGSPLVDAKGNLVYKQVTQEELDYANEVLFRKGVDVGTTIQLATLFVNNLRQFVTTNFQGIMDSLEIQRRISKELDPSGEVEEKVVSEFNKEVKKQEEEAIARFKKNHKSK